MATVGVASVANVGTCVVGLHSADVQVDVLALTRQTRRARHQLESIHLVDELIEPSPVDSQRWIAGSFASQYSLGTGRQDGSGRVNLHLGTSWTTKKSNTKANDDVKINVDG